MLTVKAKFRCNSVTDYGSWKEVKLSPVINTDGALSDMTEEDKAFWAATPSGELKMSISTTKTADYFVPTQSYYLTFNKA